MSLKNMKLLFLFFPLFLFGHLNIIFVHIGDKIPVYVHQAIQQAKLFNKEASFYFLANDSSLKKQVFTEGVKLITLESLTPSQAHQSFIKNSKHNKNFMAGFWQYTIERFFYLEEFVNQHQIENVFHLENDMMLYRNLEDLLPIFLDNYPAISATFDADTRVIPGFLFFKNAKALTNLCKHLSTNAINQLDMMSIAAYQNSSNQDQIDFLPIIFPEYEERRPLQNLKGKAPKNPSNYWKNFDKFDSIFDAAALGQYLGGRYMNPRRRKKNNSFINETCIFNPSLLEYKWIEDDEGRKIPHVFYKNQLIRINNLHIHSKRLHLFSSTR